MKAVVINKFVQVSSWFIFVSYPVGVVPNISMSNNRYLQSYSDVQVSEVPTPVPKDDEILIQVKAAGVNFVDTLYVSRVYPLADYQPIIPQLPERQSLTSRHTHQAKGKHQNNRRHVKPPFTLGLEFSGVILSIPSSLAHTIPFRPGDRIYGDMSGSYAEQILYPASQASSSLHPIPASWSFAEAAGIAATLPVSYGAFLALGGEGGLRPGTIVLVHAAAGGLGLAAVQIARAKGCRVLGTAGGPEKCRIAEAFGAEKCVDYTANQKWWEEILALTSTSGEGEGSGVDVVFDSVGLVNQSLKCVAHRGKVLVVGFAGRDGDSIEDVKMNKVLLKQVSLIGYVSLLSLYCGCGWLSERPSATTPTHFSLSPY